MPNEVLAEGWGSGHGEGCVKAVAVDKGRRMCDRAWSERGWVAGGRRGSKGMTWGLCVWRHRTAESNVPTIGVCILQQNAISRHASLLCN